MNCTSKIVHIISREKEKKRGSSNSQNHGCFCPDLESHEAGFNASAMHRSAENSLTPFCQTHQTWISWLS
ncbi:hypothetical protein BJY04DRAFT_193419 [Aspergillus karnatakaensis]|uniref:uncharacterized protein n=1 Tax=Aspergillus karnatakaensis TaxID=1810916 RepID=UPI003CCE2099